MDAWLLVKRPSRVVVRARDLRWPLLDHCKIWVCMCDVLRPVLLHALMHVPLTIARLNHNPVAVLRSTSPGMCRRVLMYNFQVAAQIRFILSLSRIYRAGVRNCLAIWYVQPNAHTRLFVITCID